jgi:hypothetical protein
MMAKKKVGLSAKTRKMMNDKTTALFEIDEWVKNKSNQKVSRMTIDLPEDLHKKIKISCVQEGKTISQVVRSLLLKEFA